MEEYRSSELLLWHTISMSTSGWSGGPVLSEPYSTQFENGELTRGDD